MSNPEPNTPIDGLSPEAAALLEAWIMSLCAGAAAVPQPEPERLVEYLAGALSAEQLRAVERGLVEHASGRATLREVRTILDGLQDAPLRDRLQQSGDRTLFNRVADAWTQLLGSRVEAAPRANEFWLSRGWSAVREGVAAGTAEAHAAWAAFQVFAEQLQVQLRGPRLAAARGTVGRPRVLGTLPAGAEVESVDAEILDDGTLRVVVRLQCPGDLTGTRAFLGVAWGETVWPLAAGVVQGVTVEWSVAAFGPAAGLGAGAFPREYIALVFSGAEQGLSPRRLLMLAPVLDESGAPAGHRTATLYVLPEPTAAGGALSIPVAVPLETRSAYRNHDLRLDLMVGAGECQRLGEWPLGQWDDQPQTLTVPWPGPAATGLPVVSLLRATLRPQAPPAA